MKRYLNIGVFLVSLGALASQVPVAYQYWFDSDVSTLQKGSTSSGSFNFEANATSLGPGGHQFQYRLLDESGQWGAPYWGTFFVPFPTEATVQSAASYEYWLDGNRDNSVKAAFEDGKQEFKIEATELTPGGHKLSYRLMNTEGIWGPVINSGFYIPMEPVGLPTAGYEYWIDNDTENIVGNVFSDGNTNIAIGSLDLSSGGHTFKYRLRDTEGKWGAQTHMPIFVPFNDLPNVDKKLGYQYWVDNDFSNAVTKEYDEASEELEITLPDLKEGGHTLSYRLLGENNAWSPKLTKPFYLPISPDQSSSDAVAYRVFLSQEIIKTVKIDDDTTSFDLTQSLPENVILDKVSSRSFSHLKRTVKMEASGIFTYAVQWLSDKNEWGAPIYSENNHSVNSSVISDSIAVPGDWKFNKVDNNNFQAFRFRNDTGHPVYFKPTQDCTVEVYYMNGDESMGRLETLQLKKNVTTKFEGFYSWIPDNLVVIYDTPKDDDNTAEDIFLKIMYEDNKLPAPEIKFDTETWAVSITCADQRAKIYYTINGDQPNAQSTVYAEPIVIDQPRTVRAYAVYDDLADSDVATNQITELTVPMPELVNVDGRLFTFTNKVEGVSTYYTLDGSSPLIEDEAETTRILFTGEPFTIEDNCRVRAFSSKDKLKDSQVSDQYVYLRDYITSEPYFNTSERDNKFYVSVGTREGTTYYRTFTGTDESAAGEWLPYEDEIPVTGNMTVQAYSKTENKSNSDISSHYTDWVRADQPITEYDNYMLKLKTTVPGGVIRYYHSNDYEEKVYSTDSLPNGLDVKDIWVVYAYVDAPGYNNSSMLYFYKDNYNLNQPNIEYADGYVDITHEDENVTIVPTITPAQDYETVSSNHIRFKPQYNTEVKAYVKKTGYNNSGETTMSAADKPTIYVNEYNVSIDYGYWWTGAAAYYTTDGSVPTAESTRYTGNSFESKAGTVRAVFFADGYIPSEADPVKVYDPTAEPVAEFNYGKLKLSCDTPGAKIYYAINQGVYDGSKILYDETETPDGFDITNASYIYAYAEADGYRKSNDIYVNMNDAYISAPNISYNNDMIEIWHDDPAVTIVPTFVPEHEYTYDRETNRITAKVAYNTRVSAHGERIGCENSSENNFSQIDKPTIYVDGYNVWINNYWGGETYYTTDGSMPTKESTKYDGEFTASAGTIRAVAFVDGYVPMEADPVQVMDQAATPVIEYDNGYVKLTSSTPGVTIYYSLDISINNNTRVKYDPATMTNGVDMTSAERIYVYAESDNYRRSETSEFYKSANILSQPSATYADGYVTASHDDSSVSFIFKDGDGNTLTPDASNPNRVQVGYNTTVKAYAHKKGYVDSYEVTVDCTYAPTMYVDLFTVSINSGYYGQEIYYTTDGSAPTKSSNLYTEPFKVNQTCTVRAVAFYEGMIPAEGQSVNVTYKKAVKPSVGSYDGRYLTLAAEEGATVIYNLDGGELYDYGYYEDWKDIDVDGLKTVKAKAIMTGADDSDEFSFAIKYYANDTDAYTSEPGHMKDAFKWCDDLSILENLTVHGSLNSNSLADGGDYAYLNSLPALRHLDLSNVTDTIVPDSAFVSDRLLSVVLPQGVKRIGSALFGDDNTTLCALELSGSEFLPDSLLNGVNNPNLLLYARSSAQADQLIAGNSVVKNVVLPNNNSSRASEVTLVHGQPFNAPKEFTAQKITFTRQFTKETPIGGYGAGWETMVIPFDVQTITHAGNQLQPFGMADLNSGVRPFWLFEPGDTDWMEAYSIQANVPYLVAFPNNPEYADEYNVRGDVVFSANNVNVQVTPSEGSMAHGFGAGKYIWGNYGRVEMGDDVLAINDTQETYKSVTFEPGGIFIANRKDVAPFECFVSSDSGRHAMPVFDSSDVETIMGEYGTKIWSEGHDIYIRSGIGMRVRIFDTVGQLLRVVDVKAGETTRVADFNAGLYIVGNTKIYVKG